MRKEEETGDHLRGKQETEESYLEDVYFIIRKKVVFDFLAGNLPEDWLVLFDEAIDSNLRGLVIAHSEFLAIQDEVKDIDFNSKRAKNALKQYMELLLRFRKKQEEYFKRLMQDDSFFTKEEIRELERLYEIYSHLFYETSSSGEKICALVCVPYYDDNPGLWEKYFNISKEKLNQIPTWIKIYETGVCFASEKYRDDDKDGRGHDIFYYCCKRVETGGENTPEENFFQVAKHEGSHGPIDWVIVQILNLNGQAACNIINEGWANLHSGEIKPDEKPTDISFDTAINYSIFPKLSDEDIGKYMRELNYKVGVKVYSAIVRILSDKLRLSPEEIYLYLAKHMIKTAFEMRQEGIFYDENGQYKNPNEVIAQFFYRLFNKLGLDIEELCRIYDDLNRPKSG